MSSEIAMRLSNAALAFRGYNVTNLGRSSELLAHPAYRPIVEAYLNEASQTCSAVIGRPVDLVRRVAERQETTLEAYAEAIALIVAIQQAQLRLLAEFHGIDYHDARVSFGFSLGEISALIAGGTFTMSDALKVPLTMAADGVELARDVTLAVVFSRAKELSLEHVKRTLLRINFEGRGVIGVSAHLSPNSVLVLGSGDTIGMLKRRLHEIGTNGIHLRRNDQLWPPMHTPIVWEKNIPNRSAAMLHTVPGGFTTPQPPVLSLVSGRVSYDDDNCRDHVIRWIDHTQRLWDAVYEVLVMGVDTVLHVGPDPNIIPATFNRLAIDVEAQTKGSRRMRALSAVINRPWLKSLLPRRAALLRAPTVRHIVLEDWLLQNAPG